MNEKTIDWRRAFQALDPLRPVSPDSEAYCPRPERPLDRLAATLRLNNRPGLYLVSGHIGTGKSTELLRLADELADTHSCFYEQTDADLWRDPPSDKAFFGILTLALKTMASGKDWRDLRRREDWMTQLRELMGSMKTSSGIGIANIRVPSIEPSQIEQAAQLAGKVRSQSLEPLVILDGFDKVDLAALERLFMAVSKWESLPVSVVLTVPLSFLFTSLFATKSHLFTGTAVVPAVRTADREGSRYPQGFQWMHSMLSLRDVDELIDHDAVEILTSATGGILRDFLRVTREAAVNAHVEGAQRIGREHAENAVRDFAMTMSRAVSSDDIRLLYAVQRTGRAVGSSSFLQLIDSGHIIEYRNGSNWYAIHPLMRELVAEQAEAFLEARAS